MIFWVINKFHLRHIYLMKGSGYKKVVNMKVLDILYVRYFKEDGSILSIGGVESYITQLGKLAVSLGIKVRVF